MHFVVKFVEVYGREYAGPAGKPYILVKAFIKSTNIVKSQISPSIKQNICSQHSVLKVQPCSSAFREEIKSCNTGDFASSDFRSLDYSTARKKIFPNSDLSDGGTFTKCNTVL